MRAFGGLIVWASMGTRFSFSQSSGDVETRGTYVHVTARGVLASIEEVRAFYRLIEEALPKATARRVLLDAREATDEPSNEVRDASWKGLARLQLERVAYVVSGAQPLKATRLNMTALSSSIPIRAFDSFLEAHRWLAAPVKP